MGSYPTYEEWKLCITSFLLFKNKSSYPTYEEWKPVNNQIQLLDVPAVLILPMRNGN